MYRISNRKVQRVGKSLYICIPKIWAEDHQIEKGCSIDLFLDDDGNLMLRKLKKIEEVEKYARKK